MTIHEEKVRAVKDTREFLYYLITLKSKDLKLSTIKDRAGRCLRHYPIPYEIEQWKELAK